MKNKYILTGLIFLLSGWWMLLHAQMTGNTISTSSTLACPGIPLSLIGNPPGGCTGTYLYQWESSSDNSSWGTISGATGQNYSPSISGNTYFRRVASSTGADPGCVSVPSNTLAIALNAVPSAPINLVQSTICVGQIAILQADPGAGGNDVVWYSAPVGGTLLATGNNYTPAPAVSTPYYISTLNTTTGCESSPRTVINVTVTILPVPTGISSPVRCGPGNVSLTATPGAGSNDIRWYYPSTILIGQGSPFTYSVSGSITVYATSYNTSTGCSSAEVATNITVHPVPGNNTLLTDQTICTGSAPVMLTGSLPTGGDGSYTYAWQSSPDLISWNTVTAQTGQNYTPGAQTSNVYFRRIVTTSVCNPTTSNALVVQVDNIIGNNSVSSAQTICSGFAPAQFTGSQPTGGNGIYSYQWQSSTDNVSFASVGGGNGQNLTSGALTNSTYFRRVVTSGACPAQTSTSLLVTVIPVITSNTVGNAQTICTGSSPAMLTGTAPGGGTGVYAYQWETSLNNSTFLPVTGATASTYTSGPLSATTYFRRVVTSVCTNSSVSVQVLVNSNIGNNNITANQTVCQNTAGAQLNGSLPNGGNGIYTYSWQTSTDNISWNIVGGAAAQNYIPTAISVNTYYRRVVTSGPCLPVTTSSISITVNLPIGNNQITADQTTCANVSAQVLNGSAPSGGNGSYTYGWESSTDNLVWVSIPGQVNPTYTVGQITASRYYRRIVSSAPCSPNSSNSVYIFVYPVIGNTTINTSQTICTGTAPAQITGLIVNGGTGTYTYQWQSSPDNLLWGNIAGQTNLSYTPGVLTQNIYYRRTVDSPPCNNISNTVSITINQPLGNNTIGNAQSICTGQAPGQLTGSVPTGGTGVFSYTWQSSPDNLAWSNVTGGNGVNLVAGILTQARYFRRVVSSGACPAVTSNEIFIVVFPNLTGNTITGNQTICAGGQPGDLTGNLPSGGTGIYTYVWETSPDNVNWAVVPQETDIDFVSSTLTVSTYFRRIVPGTPCVASTSNTLLVVVQNSIGNNIATASQTICTGTAPAQFVGIVPTGGSGTYTYQWVSSTDNMSFTNIAGGTLISHNPPVLTVNTYYRRVVVSGVCNPSSSASIIITINQPIGINTIGSQQSLCAGGSFGQLTGTLPSGGNGIYTYLWQTSINNTNWFDMNSSTSMNQAPFVLNASTYFRRVVTSSPCTANSSASVFVFVEPAITSNTIGNNQTICTGTTPLAFTGTSAVGGNGIFTYQWESSLTTAVWTTMSGETNLGSSSGPLTVTTYFRRVANSGLCPPTSANLLTIRVDDFIGDNIIGADQTICNGSIPAQFTGQVPTGGSGAYNYTWQTSADSLAWGNANGINNLQTYLSGPVLINLYYRRLVQSGVCRDDTSGTVKVTVQSFLSGNTLGTAQTVCAGTAPASFTGTNPSGGSGVYSYTWQTSIDNVNWFVIPGETGATYTHGPLSSAMYFRRIVASGSCPVLPSNGILISVQQGLTNNLVGTNQALCEGLVPSLLTGAVPNGGTGIYMYSWETSSDNLTWLPASGVSNNIDYLPTDVLYANTYYRRITASGVCANSLSNTIIVTVYPIPSVTIAPIEICLGKPGTITANPSLPGGTYLWNTGASTPGITVSPFNTTTYTVQYTLNGCISPIGQGVVTVNPLPIPVITSSGPLILCPSGSVSLTASGGSSYLWSNGVTTNTVVMNSAGTFRVIVTDLKGCVDSTFTTITQPAPLNIIPTVVNPSCFGLMDGSVSLNVTGGTLPYAFTWNTNPIQTVRNIFNLTIGTYTVSVSDQIGCLATSTVILTEPRPLSIYSTHNSIACTPLMNNGVASTFVSGGTPPYQYLWNSVPPQFSAGAFNLTPGSYSVDVTDANGCVIADTITLVADISPSVQASADTFVCANSGGVLINSTPSGGVGPYTHVWSQSSWIIPGSISDAYVPSPNVNPDSSGWYYVQVFGSNGCPSNMDSLYVTVYPLPLANAGPDLEFCAEAPGVFLQGSIGNPIGGYHVQWVPSAGLFCDTCLVTYAQPLQTTIYTMVVTNLETGCKSDSTTLNTLSSALITVKDLPIADAGRDTLICLADSAKLLGTVTASGPLYTWDWSPSLELNDRTLQTPNASPTSTTIYFVVATSNGCESHADSMELKVIPYPVVAAGQQKNICAGDSITLAGQVQQGTAQTFLWTPGTGLSDSTALNPNASPASTTTYTLRAYNQGCPSLPASMLLIVKPVPQADAGRDTVICTDGDSIVLNASFTGGYFPFRYEWSPPGGLERVDIFSPKAKPTATQFYYFTVSSGTAPDLCQTTDSVLITVVPSVNLQMSVDTTAICPGEFVQFTSSGGVGNAKFVWSPGTGIAQPNSPNPRAYPVVPTRYYLTVSEGGCSQTDSIDIYVHPAPVAAFNTSQLSGCAPVEVSTQNLSVNALSYQWRIASLNYVSNEMEPVIRFNEPGQFPLELVVRGIGGCADTMLYPLLVDVNANAKIDFITEPPIPLEVTGLTQMIRFEDKTPGAVSWLWDFGDGNYSQDKITQHTYTDYGYYKVTLKVTTAEGCEGTAIANPITVRQPNLDIPNVFSPNGDGMNDFFSTGYDGDEKFMLQIYDRWGVKFYETRNRLQPWDGLDLNGQPAPEGVYFYTVEAGPSKYSGSLSLVR